KNRHKRKTTILAKGSGSIAEILNQVLQPVPTASIAADFLDLLDSAQGELGLAASLLGTKSSCNSFSGLFFDVEADFIVKVALDSLSAEQRTQPYWDRIAPAHLNPRESHDARDRGGKTLPVGCLGLQLLAARFGQGIKLGATAIFGELPVRFDPALL